LVETLGLPTIPVYYGAPNAPNITIHPSFIRVSDFASPEDLAKYLLFLSTHSSEYHKYLEWKKDPAHKLDDYYLKTMQNRVAGPVEV
jgi:hypothetical protein